MTAIVPLHMRLRSRSRLLRPVNFTARAPRAKPARKIPPPPPQPNNIFAIRLSVQLQNSYTGALAFFALLYSPLLPTYLSLQQHKKREGKREDNSTDRVTIIQKKRK